MFALIAYATLITAPAPTYTVREVTIVSKPVMTCTTRDLIQGSGTVKICERAK